MRTCLSETHWYVMRAYKCERKAEEQLEDAALNYFIPKQYAIRVYHGVKSKRLVPVIPSLVFVHATREQILEFKKQHNFLQFVMWENNSAQECLVVPDVQMEDFIRVASLYEENTAFYAPEEIDIKKGARVRIHGGKLDGVTGVFMQIRGKRNRRLVVLLEGVMAVTIEVHPDLVEILDKNVPENQ